MDTTAANTEDTLVDEMDFSLKNSASYIQSRRFSSFFPAGGNSYSPNCVKVIRVNLTSENGWLDPMTTRVLFTLNNLALPSPPPAPDKILRPLSGGWSFFQRLRIIVGGQVVEDIADYARVAEIFYVLTPENVRKNEDIENFGHHYDLA